MRPLRRPPPRHRARSGAARRQLRRAKAGQTGAEPPGLGHSEARQLEAQQLEAQLSEAQLSEAQQTKVGQPEVGRLGPEPKTEPLEAGQLQAGQLQANQPSDRHVGPAFRRLMVTPTFAAGLGVVVAAGLAVSMTSRTVLHFSGPEGKPCVVRGCATGANRSPGAGTPASASPGKRLVPSTLGPENSARPSPSFTGKHGGEDSGHRYSGSKVVVDYETTQRFSWGFDGQITISGLPDSALSTWRLGFNYPGTRIVEVQGAQWQSTGDDSGVAQAETSGGTGQNGSDSGDGSLSGSGPDASGYDSQNTVVITIEASGTPSTPSDCRFDDPPCSFR